MSENDTEIHAESIKNGEESTNNLKYPQSIPFIISNVFCERFNFYGMRAILVLYLTRKLLYTDDDSTIIYHTFNCLAYFFCIFGAILADSWWGKFNTILYLSIVSIIGSGTIAFSAIQPWIDLDWARVLTFIVLGLIAMGSGSVKPCVTAFGGEQFKVPEQARQLATFFSLFYFSINAGSLIATSVTPILHEDVQCFNMEDCYPLAFGVPATLMIISILIFVAGKFLYNILPSQGNMAVRVTSCIVSAVKTRKQERKINPREHWVEYAENTHGKKLTLETRTLLNIIVLFLPLPFFWALFDQQGSRWTFQATRMNGDIGFYQIPPDQMQLLNPLLILILIPLYEVAICPLLNLIGFRRPLRKMALGGILASVAFVLSALVEFNLEKTYAILPERNESQLRIFNGRNCKYTFTTDIPGFKIINVDKYSSFQEQFINVTNRRENFTYEIKSKDCFRDDHYGFFELEERVAVSYFLEGSVSLRIYKYHDNPEKSRQEWPLITVLANIPGHSIVKFVESDNSENLRYRHPASMKNQTEIQAARYNVFVDNEQVTSDLELLLGGVYTIVIGSNKSVHLFTVTSPNSLHMLWQLPQYIVITLGEIMFSVTGLEFSFTQAPESMKSVLQGCWMLTIAFGNVIGEQQGEIIFSMILINSLLCKFTKFNLVVIITGAKFFNSQMYEFLLFAGLMFADVLVFSWLAVRYKEIPLHILKNEDEEERRLILENNENPAFDTR